MIAIPLWERARVDSVSPRNRLKIYGRAPRNPLEESAAKIHVDNQDVDQATNQLPSLYVVPIDPDAKEKKRRAAARRGAATREEIRRIAALRMAMRFGKPLELQYIDYRYWQCRRCGFNADDSMIWFWWRGIHWTEREEIAVMSRGNKCAGTSKNKFR